MSLARAIAISVLSAADSSMFGLKLLIVNAFGIITPENVCSKTYMYIIYIYIYIII